MISEPITAITVSVGYHDLLEITLPISSDFVNRVIVVTSMEDDNTPKVAKRIPNALVYATNAFYEDGAYFNKGKAIEEALDFAGRRGWFVTLDADIVVPDDFGQHLENLNRGCLYGPWRRILRDPRQYRAGLDWSFLPRGRDQELAGYCQIFHSSADALGEPPWFGTNWIAANGYDSDLYKKYQKDGLAFRLDFDVLHLGTDTDNWCGRVTPYLDGSVDPLAGEHAKHLGEMFMERHIRGNLSGERI